MTARSVRSDFHAFSTGARRGPAPRCRVPSPAPANPPKAGTAVMSRTGTRTERSRLGGASVATTVTGCAPPRNRATSSRGRTVADSPMRWAGASSKSSSRSNESDRCAPRLSPARACTSSTMTVSTVRSASRAADVSMRYSDSGVVMRISGGLRAILRRSSAGVSPVRMAVRISGAFAPRRALSTAASSEIAESGPCKLRSTSAPRAFRGDTYSTRTPRTHFSPASATRAFSPMSASIAHRNAANVLPEPVGAITSAFSPRAIACHASACTAVGAPKASANQ